MRYLSPAALFGGTLPDPLDKKAIQLQRKKMLAELDLSADESLQIGEKTYTRNDIINYFEALLEENILPFHQAIANDKTLLRFLEEDQFYRRARFAQNPIYSDPEFIKWISPYFYDGFVYLLNICFQQSDDSTIETILDNPLLMTEYDQERAWIQISNMLENDISMLEYYQSQKRQPGDVLTVDEVSPLMNHLRMLIILRLPDYRFGQIRDNYAFAMMQAAIYAFNLSVNNRDLTEIWMDNALSLAYSEDTKQQLKEKQSEMTSIQNASTYSNTRTKKNEFPRIIWFIILVVIKVATCNSFHSTPTYSPVYNLPTIRQSPYKSTTQGTRDTLSGKAHDRDSIVNLLKTRIH